MLSLFFTIVDAKNQTSTITIPIPAATPVAVLGALTAAVASLLAPLLRGGLRTAGAKLEFDVHLAFGATPYPESDVQEKAEFGFHTVLNHIKRLGLPTFDEAHMVVSSTAVDIADTDVAAFVDFMTDGITVSATLVQPSDTREEDITILDYAREAWGRARN